MPDAKHDPGNPLEAERDRLLATLGRSRQERSFPDSDVRTSARDYGRAARSARLPPERLVISLKQLTHAPELAQFGDWFRRVLTDRVIVWAIDAYYDLESD